jgi:hypothetical protein
VTDDMGGYESPSFYEVAEYDRAASVAAQFATLGGETAYVALQFAQAHKDYLESKVTYDRVWAKTYLTRRELLLAGGSKPTENTLEAVVSNDDEVFAARMALVGAEARREKWRGALEAIRAKKDALVGLAASARAEMQAWGAERTK